MKSRSYLLDELDKTLALFGTIFSLILTIWIKLVIGQPIFVVVGMLCFMVCIGYLIIRSFIHPSLISSLEELRCSTRFYVILNILFFFLLSYSIISIHLRTDPYIRPLWYFISTAIMAVIVANEILFLSHKKSYIYFALCKITIIGLSLTYSQILIFPSIVGIDPWYHQWFTLKILDNGFIPEGLMYSKLPLMHLMIVITSLVTDLGYKMAAMFSISSLQIICDTFFVFLLGKYIISNKVGLLAALLLNIANQHIFFGYAPIPNTMAAIMILPIIFILFKLRRDKPFISTLLVMLLMGTLILTHPIVSMCLAILLFTFWLSFEAYTRLFHREIDCYMTWTIWIFFSTGMLAYWLYISGHIKTLSYLIILGFNEPLFDEVYQSFSNIPFLEHIFSYLGMFLFFSLSFIGCLYMMSKQFRNCNRFSITIGGIVILCIALFSLITEKVILIGRWLYFSQIYMAIPLSLSLILLNEMFKNKLIKSFLISLSVFTLSFLLIFSPAANIDNRLFIPKSGVRYAFTDSELQAMDTISEIYNGTLGVDGYYATLLNRARVVTDYTSINNPLVTGDFRALPGIMIIIREEIVNHALFIPYTTLTLNYNPFITLEEQNYSRIYNCGSASGFLKP